MAVIPKGTTMSRCQACALSVRLTWHLLKIVAVVVGGALWMIVKVTIRNSLDDWRSRHARK